MSQIDHIQGAYDRLITQYRESQTVKDYLASNLFEANELEQVGCDLLDRRSIDTATGVQLDLIGLLVGQPRAVVVNATGDYFGFGDSNEAFGSITDPGIGGEWFSLSYNDETRDLTDDEYRLMIKARILKNITNATWESIIESVLFLFNPPGGVIITEGHLAYLISIGKNLDSNENFIILNNVIPKPIGVRVNYATFDPTSSFSYSDVPNIISTTEGFSTSTDPGSGGSFSTIL